MTRVSVDFVPTVMGAGKNTRQGDRSRNQESGPSAGQRLFANVLSLCAHVAFRRLWWLSLIDQRVWICRRLLNRRGFAMSAVSG